MIPGNHDGAYGSEDINGDGEISGATDYYIYNLSPNELYDLVYRKVSLINGVTLDESYNGYYVDDTAAKVRYILINTHYSDGAVNENGTAVNNYMRKMRIGQNQQNMVLEALRTVPGEDWNVIVGSHMPLTAFQGEGGGGDLPLLREVLTAYQNKAVYSGTFGTEGEYDFVSVDADFTEAKGCVIGAFAGHLHDDLSNTDYAYPIILTSTDAVESGEVGTVTEQSFDVYTVNKRTGVINATKIGYGSDRVFDVATEEAYTNLADPTSEDWHNNSYLDSSGVATASQSNQLVTNFIPVEQYDIVRWKGLDMVTSASTAPTMSLYDENKVYIGYQSLANGSNSIIPVMVTDENGVTSYEILMRGSTGQQFVYGDWCTRTKFIRFSFCPLTTAEDIIITVNEEIV